MPIGYATFATQAPSSTPTAPTEPPDSSSPSGTQPREGGADILTDLFDELIKQEPEETEPRRNVFFYQDADFFSETEHYEPRAGGSGGGNAPKASFSRQFDQPIARSQDSSLADLIQTEREASAISAAEELLRPPASRVDQGHGARSARAGSKPSSGGDSSPSLVRANAAYLGARPERIHAQPSDYTVMVISGEVASGQRVVRSLGDYKVERADDGVTGLAKLISFKPDLVVLDVDLQIIDGFKLLEHIRANLDVPIIALSSSHIRASDRIKAAELGADYFLTKPFAIKELRQKARQLIARYRGIDEWITPTSGGADWDTPPEEGRGGSRPAEPGYQSEEESFQQDPSAMRRASDKQAQERRPARNGYG
ncbi:MAG: response regulator, partial [Blastocatellia bacterium]